MDLLGIASQISIVAAIIYIPFLQMLFKTTAIDLADWLWLALLALIVIAVEEGRKWFTRRL